MNILSGALLAGFGVGVVAIPALRLLVAGLSGAIVASLLAIGIIVIVGVYYQRNVGPDDRQVAGDNLYYLGLLFTLVSLILALTQLFVLEASGTIDERAYELIGNFGVALLSTVAGILARILLHSGSNVPAGAAYRDGAASPADPSTLGPRAHKGSPDSGFGAGHSTGEPDAGSGMPGGSADGRDGDQWPTHRAGAQMHEETTELRYELDRLRLVLREATDAFSHFNRVTVTLSEDAMTHTGSVMSKFNEDTVAAVTEQLEQATVAMQAASQTLRTQSDALTRHFEAVVAEFNSKLSAAAQGGIEDTAAVWRTAAGEMRADGQRQIELFSGNVAKLVAATEGTWNEMSTLTGRIAAAGRDLDAQAADLRGMVRENADVSRGMRQCTEQIDAARERLGAAAEATGEAARSVTASAREVARAETTVESGLKRAGEVALQGYEAAATEFADRVRERLQADSEEWLATTRDARAELDRHREASAESLMLARRANRQLSENAAQWTELAERTNRQLAEEAARWTEAAEQTNRQLSEEAAQWTTLAERTRLVLFRPRLRPFGRTRWKKLAERTRLSLAAVIGSLAGRQRKD